MIRRARLLDSDRTEFIVVIFPIENAQKPDPRPKESIPRSQPNIDQTDVDRASLGSAKIEKTAINPASIRAAAIGATSIEATGTGAGRVSNASCTSAHVCRAGIAAAGITSASSSGAGIGTACITCARIGAAGGGGTGVSIAPTNSRGLCSTRTFSKPNTEGATRAVTGFGTRFCAPLRIDSPSPTPGAGSNDKFHLFFLP